MTINEQKLAQIKLVNPVSFDGRTVEAGSSVVDLAKLGRDEKLAVEVLASVMEVLGTQTE
jgi:hypothetical protein